MGMVRNSNNLYFVCLWTVEFICAATKTIGSVQTSLMQNIEPLVSILAAVILLGESLVLSQTLGVAVILVALVLASATQQGFSFFKMKNR